MDQVQQILKSIMTKLGITWKEDSPKNQNEESKELTRLSMECILSYMDPSKRLCLSYFSPKIRPIEKGVPLVLKFLHISKNEIVGKIILQVLHKDKRICRLVPEKEAKTRGFVDVEEFDDDVTKICCAIFTGRRQFKIHNFQCEVQFPFEMDFKVGRAIVDARIGLFAKNYANITGTIKNVLFVGLDRPEELRLPWIRNVDRIESLIEDSRLIKDVLPNIQAKRICIDCTNNTHLCSSLIIKWFSNDPRAVGSELILTMARDEEQMIFNHIFSRNLLAVFGFVRHEDDSLRSPMGNNLEAVLRKNNERHLFTPIYLNRTNPRNYLHLKVQHKQP